ncbi:MAG TPA: cyclic pyranopterin monophosphate synthase MoaC [Eubacteriaceae bacterium]|nr:cyclic pyranopterin monophosphate synthase MoaC [Eubacteriaceae bacterium]
MELTHLDEQGNARMVNVSGKKHTERKAWAQGVIRMKPETLEKIVDGTIEKGDVLSVARTAGIMAAKKTDDLIPMCHNVPLDGVEVKFEVRKERSEVLIEAMAACVWKTGVEMEALVAATVAGLTIYDMCKAVDKGMEIGEVALVKKTGGKSGTYIREENKHGESNRD